MGIRHFLQLPDLPSRELQQLIARARVLKKEGGAAGSSALQGRVLVLLFEKASTRTRIGLEAAMARGGGSSLFVDGRTTQLQRGESWADTARVLSSMVDAVAIRTTGHHKLEEFAAYSTVPVINSLSDSFHPCQLLADMQTFLEERGAINGKTVAWVGDGNNLCQTYIHAARCFDFQLRIACPEAFAPDDTLLRQNSDRVRVSQDPAAAVAGASLVVTDVWASMGREAEAEERRRAFAGFQVNRELLRQAAPDALIMHCLPAHRGEEIEAALLDAPNSVIWRQAENRLYTQQALLELLLERSS